MRVDSFDFALPRHLIADRPAEPRDAARLLVVAEGLADRTMLDLPGLLRPGDVLVVNDTRVIPARLTGRRGAAHVEVTLHQDLGGGRWRAFAKGARKLKPGDRIEFAADFAAEVAEKEEGELVLAFTCEGTDLRAALERYGVMPLPPYIKRGAAGDPRDRGDYQTIFARVEGAVAAPTAGLHFTERLLAALEARGIPRVSLTLHVGAATFLPVRVDDTDDHRMHGEWGVLDDDAARRLNAARAAGGRIVACGTTSVRLLESAADEAGRIRAFAGETKLFITPPYRFRAVDLMLTNFHLPRSTLFMLVSAFAGLERMKAAYAHAIAHNYRFFSYGDATLLHPARHAA
ncbi:MAG TPA: tRNA preQ1(34) S-adenosylmethionine ribosyltransferase-isomerase QueA [Stellaceae bacterium]|nr:tRNA preQ1(34) S-adenosylmethionine ribosyltransferase-isomerase QueA [Stellaceae bacterium]